MKRFLATLLLLPTWALADIDDVIDNHILPGHAAFLEASQDLARAAESCDPNLLITLYHNTFDAWMGISHIQFGPVEIEGLSLRIAFWPDPKDRTHKALAQLIRDQDPVVNTPAEYEEVSVAAQGLFALERILFEERDNTEYTCLLTQAITRQLANDAALLDMRWRTEYADTLRTPGTENPRYRSQKEVLSVLYTALFGGLEFTHNQRLGRPLGSFDRPRPQRAEARRSARSLRNIALNLEALRSLAMGIVDNDIPKTIAAFDKAIAYANGLVDPDLAGVSVPQKRIRIEALQHLVFKIQQATATEIGDPLGIQAGFNSLDGD